MQGVVWPLIVTMAIQALVSLVVYTPPVLAPVVTLLPTPLLTEIRITRTFPLTPRSVA